MGNDRDGCRERERMELERESGVGGGVEGFEEDWRGVLSEC